MTWSRIVCHHSASPDHDWLDTNDIEFWHEERGWRRIGYHKVIEQVSGKYRAIMGRPLFMIGSHSKGFNRNAIGVCFVGNFEESTMPDAQLEVGAECIAELCLAYRIPVESIWMHRDCGQTACPGKHFPQHELVRRVRQKIRDEVEVQ